MGLTLSVGHSITLRLVVAGVVGTQNIDLCPWERTHTGRRTVVSREIENLPLNGRNYLDPALAPRCRAIIFVISDSRNAASGRRFPSRSAEHKQRVYPTTGCRRMNVPISGHFLQRGSFAN
jgi:hypothetical protein